MVNGVYLVPPVAEICLRKDYWLCNLTEPDLPHLVRQDNYNSIRKELEKKFLFTTKDAAVLYTNHVLLAEHKKLIEDGEI